MEIESQEQTKQIDESHLAHVKELETSFQTKMAIEVARFQKLQEDLEREREEWSKQYKIVDERHSHETESKRGQFEITRAENEEERNRIMVEKETEFRSTNKISKGSLERASDQQND